MVKHTRAYPMVTDAYEQERFAAGLHGLAWMVFATLFPLGVLQLYHSVSQGYYEACTVKFLTNRLNILIEWLRFPGDVLFIVGGVLPVLYLAWLGIRHLRSIPVEKGEERPLFTEVKAAP